MRIFRGGGGSTATADPVFAWLVCAVCAVESQAEHEVLEGWRTLGFTDFGIPMYCSPQVCGGSVQYESKAA